MKIDPYKFELAYTVSKLARFRHKLQLTDCLVPSKMQNADHLQERLLEIWHGIQQTVINDAINEWRDRLEACVVYNLS